MTVKQKRMLIRILGTFGIYIALTVTEHLGLLPFGEKSPVWPALYLIPYFFIGWDIIYRALRNIRNGQVFDENFLMALATVGAFAVQQYSEAVAVMLFYQVGELFQNYAVNRSRQSISDLMDICPEYANIEEDGQLKQVDPDDVSVGDIIVIKAGERIPLDGRVISGDSMIDTSALTGESVPRRVRAGDEMISGCVNGSGLLRVEVTKEFDDSTVARILELVENASSKKAPVENFITRFARYYTPVVVIAAVVLAILPPLFFGQTWSEGIRRACTFLVISCPCALVISVPMSFFSGIGAASKKGVLVKGSNYLEALANVHTVVFDKTGTLTKGTFEVQSCNCESGVSEEELIRMIASVESSSTHPIAKAVVNYAGRRDIELSSVTDSKEYAGLGLEAAVNGIQVLAGNGRLLSKFQIEYPPELLSITDTIVVCAIGNKYAGYLLLSDSLKEDAKIAIQNLKALGIQNIQILSGDKQSIVSNFAEKLGISEAYGDLLPDGKVKHLEELRRHAENQVAFVGDGMNDAPVLALSNVGIAMGGLGSDAAIETADVVIQTDQPSKVAEAIKVGKLTRRIVWQNISLAFGVKLLVLILGAGGLATLWEAVFADVGVALIAIMNAVRIQKMIK